MPMLPREFEVIVGELDRNKSEKINYKVFLNSVYITKMYMQEL